MLTRLTDIPCQIIIKGGTRISMSLRLSLLVVMAKLDDDIVARLYLREDLIPTAFVDKALRR